MLSSFRYGVAAIFLAMSSLAFAGYDYGSAKAEAQSRVDFREINSLVWSLAKAFNKGEFSNDIPEQELDYISAFQTYLPNAADDTALPRFEEAILTAYMDNPQSQELSLLNGIYHLCRTALFGNKYGLPVNGSVAELKHAVYAQYFLHRAKRLGYEAAWLDRALTHSDSRLADLLPTDGSFDHFIGAPVHNAFTDAFTKYEGDRYIVRDALFEHLLANPFNLQTNFYSTAVNLWIGSEADYADPTMLYSYVLSAYVAERLQDFAQRAEALWENDPVNEQLFHLANEVGFFTVPTRRWLAQLHNDEVAQDLVAEEVSVWFDQYPRMYFFTAGVALFSDDKRFFDGLGYFFGGIDACNADFTRACQNSPKAPFSVISTMMVGADFLLKAGDLGGAWWFLGSRNIFGDDFNNWDLAQPAVFHRAANMNEIFARYQNDDPSDDPLNIFMNRQKWGISTTCQLCHQRDNDIYTDEELYEPPHHANEFIYVENWPEYSVTWYGEPIQ